MKNNRTTWLLGMLVVSGCFRTTPCTSDAECGGPGGVCDLALKFCVTPPKADAGAGGGGAASGGGGGAEVGGGGGALGGGGGALGGGGGELDGGMDASVDAGLDAGVAPTVLGVTPVGNTLEVLAAVRPTATFSEAMDSASLTRATFTLAQGSLVIDGGVSLDGAMRTATFTPAAPLGNNRVYTATLTTGARSLVGLSLAAAYTWTFTTAFLELGTAGACSVLGAAITNTGSTMLGGDLAVSSGTPIMGGSTITVGGSTHAGDAAAMRAHDDLQLAYTAAANMPLTQNITALDGQVLAPGIYRSGAALSLNTVLTLDAANDPNAIFLFQVDAALNTGATTSRVELIRGAQAAHVYWQASGAVTLGAMSSFKGTVLGQAAITVGAGTVVEGRVLSLSGTVTLAGNTIQ